MSLRARSAASFPTIDVDSITQDFFVSLQQGGLLMKANWKQRKMLLGSSPLGWAVFLLG